MTNPDIKIECFAGHRYAVIRNSGRKVIRAWGRRDADDTLHTFAAIVCKQH